MTLNIDVLYSACLGGVHKSFWQQLSDTNAQPPFAFIRASPWVFISQCHAPNPTMTLSVVKNFCESHLSDHWSFPSIRFRDLFWRESLPIWWLLFWPILHWCWMCGWVLPVSEQPKERPMHLSSYVATCDNPLGPMLSRQGYVTRAIIMSFASKKA